MNNMLYIKYDNTPKGTTFDTTNLQPGELIHVYFTFYNVTYIRGFTSMLTIFCERTRMIWVLPTVSKLSPVCIIRFILTTLNNEQHSWKRVRIYEDGALENSTDVTNLFVYEFNISMETTGVDALWLNEKNEIHNIIINNMVKEGLIGSNQHEKMFLQRRDISRSL